MLATTFGLVDESLLHEFVDHFPNIMVLQRSLQGAVQDMLAGNNMDGTKNMIVHRGWQAAIGHRIFVDTRSKAKHCQQTHLVMLMTLITLADLPLYNPLGNGMFLFSRKHSQASSSIRRWWHVPSLLNFLSSSAP